MSERQSELEALKQQRLTQSRKAIVENGLSSPKRSHSLIRRSFRGLKSKRYSMRDSDIDTTDSDARTAPAADIHESPRQNVDLKSALQASRLYSSREQSTREAEVRVEINHEPSNQNGVLTHSDRRRTELSESPRVTENLISDDTPKSEISPEPENAPEPESPLPETPATPEPPPIWETLSEQENLARLIALNVKKISDLSNDFYYSISAAYESVFKKIEQEGKVKIFYDNEGKARNIHGIKNRAELSKHHYQLVVDYSILVQNSAPILQVSEKLANSIRKSSEILESGSSGRNKLSEVFIGLDLQAFYRHAEHLAKNNIDNQFSRKLFEIPEFGSSIHHFRCPENLINPDTKEPMTLHEVIRHVIIDSPVMFMDRMAIFLGSYRNKLDALQKLCPETTLSDVATLSVAYDLVDSLVEQMKNLKSAGKSDKLLSAIVNDNYYFPIPPKSDYEIQLSNLRRAAFEILDTERSFNRTMSSAKVKFFDALRDPTAPTHHFFENGVLIVDNESRPKGMGKLSKDQLQALQTLKKFEGYFDSLLQTSTLIIDKFSERLKTWNYEQQYSSVFMKMGQFIKIYTVFMNFVAANDLRETFVPMLCKIREFDQFFENFGKTHGKDDFKQVFANTYVQEPFQRICRYKLLIESSIHKVEKLYTKFGEVHPDTRGLEEAHRIMSEVAASANTAHGVQEMAKELYNLSQNVSGIPPDKLIIPGRRMLRHGLLVKRSRKKDQNRYFIAFTDCLMYFKEGTVDDENYQFDMQLDFNNHSEVTLSHEMDSEKFITVISTKKSITIIFKDSRTQREWYETIHGAITQVKLDIRNRKMVQDKSAPLRLSKGPSAGSSDNIDGGGGEPAPVWIPDQNVTMCQACCVTKFTLITRRHHCRNCGFVICNTCSNFTTSKHGTTKRICTSCSLKENQEKREKRKIERSDSNVKKGVLHQPAGFQHFERFQRLQWKKNGFWRSIFMGLINTSSDFAIYVYRAKNDNKAEQTWNLVGFEVRDVRNSPDQFMIVQRGYDENKSKHAFRPELFKASSSGDKDAWMRAVEDAWISWSKSLRTV